MKCTHCIESGHEIDDCFKFHGVLDWYKKYKENRMLARANLVENDDDNGSTHNGMEHREGTPDMSKLIQLEIAKYVNNYMQQQ